MYTALVVFCWVMAAIMAILTAVNPSRLWWKTSAWRYSNPEANEPSDAAYSFGRVAMGFGALLMAGVGCWLGSAEDPNGLGSGDVYKAATQAAHDLEAQRFTWEGPTDWEVEQALTKDHATSDLTVTRRTGNAAGRVYFEITNAKGENAACIETYRLDENGDVIYATQSPPPSRSVPPSQATVAPSTSSGERNIRIKARAEKGECPGSVESSP